jgi:hypothetical protein
VDPIRLGARNFVALRHENHQATNEFRGAATKLPACVANFVACCHEIPGRKAVPLGGRLGPSTRSNTSRATSRHRRYSGVAINLAPSSLSRRRRRQQSSQRCTRRSSGSVGGTSPKPTAARRSGRRRQAQKDATAATEFRSRKSRRPARCGCGGRSSRP